jgi:hypothetical protein
MVVSQVNSTEFTLDPQVDELVTIKVTLGDTNIKTQLCRHNRKVRNVQWRT